MAKVQGFTWTVEDVNLISRTETWGDVLVELGRSDPRVVALTADLGNTTKLRSFKEAFPERYFNVGVAEQNLMAVAAGLAATGHIPVVCTYATFATLRAAEFVRTDIGYGQRNVKIIGTLAGVAFGQGGPTHHSVEDLALLRAVPGMVVLAPSDGIEMGAALRAAVAHEGPVYLRTGRGVELPVTAGPAPEFVIGRARVLRKGGSGGRTAPQGESGGRTAPQGESGGRTAPQGESGGRTAPQGEAGGRTAPHADDVAVIACGPTVQEALAAADRAEAQGIGVRVIAMASIKPLDVEAVLSALHATRRLVTVEDHSVIGGLGSAVADVIARSGKGCALRLLGHQDRYLGMGIPEDLMHLGGFDEDAIFEAICALRSVEPKPDHDWEDGA
jgi:transketolase